MALAGFKPHSPSKRKVTGNALVRVSNGFDAFFMSVHKMNVRVVFFIILK
jgi:hypothetical protein